MLHCGVGRSNLDHEATVSCIFLALACIMQLGRMWERGA
jgi:hypothetical protein